MSAGLAYSAQFNVSILFKMRSSIISDSLRILLNQSKLACRLINFLPFALLMYSMSGKPNFMIVTDVS